MGFYCTLWDKKIDFMFSFELLHNLFSVADPFLMLFSVSSKIVSQDNYG